MAEDKTKQADAVLIAVRAVVMLFGLSMVILGSYAIKAQYGSLSNYIKKESAPIVNKIESKLPKVEWDKMSRLLKVERAKQTWQLKTNKLHPKNNKPNS